MLRRGIGIGIGLVMATGGLTMPAAVATGCRVVGQPPSPGTVSNELFGVAEVSPCNIWAVGGLANNQNFGQTLIDHWNGKSWTRVPSPDPGGGMRANDLHGVAAVSAKNIWAVGDYDAGSGLLPLVIHWNGRTWRNVTIAAATENLGILDDVTAVSASDVWAVGETCPTCATDSTLTYHWNGRKWRQVTSPSPHSFAALRSVAAISSDDAWAVGDYFNGSATQSLTMHWNGTSWRKVPSPDPAGTSNPTILFGVSMSASKRAWAVGKFFDGTATETLAVRWNGKRWTRRPSPDPSPTSNVLNGVVAIAARNAWAVGEDVDSSPAGQTLAEHWNGRRWKTITSPDPGTAANLNAYNDVAALSASTVIAVGSYSDGTTTKSLATVRHDG
jgi:hypothetical protein